MTDAHAALHDLLDHSELEAAVGLIDSSGNVLAAHGDLDEPYPLASVSKVLSTYAALVAVADASLALDEPASEGTGSPEPFTVRHLLAHAAGYAFEGGEFLAKPGKRRMYSNSGIEHLAAVTERATGVPFTQFVRERVTEPLGMAGISLKGSPAKDYSACIDDLLRLAHELMDPQLIPVELAREAQSIQFEGLTGVLPGYGRQSPNDWGLGVEIAGTKKPHWTSHHHSARTFGHFGQAGSFLWVDPEAGNGGLGAAFVGSTPFGDSHRELWPELNDILLVIGAGTL